MNDLIAAILAITGIGVALTAAILVRTGDLPISPALERRLTEILTARAALAHPRPALERIRSRTARRSRRWKP
ncbi:hypothetical protein [Streptosporangium sp. NPDC002721]|uniref:hypothetical protein n=1 Tax=Streptosporangium sp. NPDC002721 TaxID=3366188 RepID=UPI0036853504